ncbi:hypothetical protein ACFC09_45315 [Streptomyces sp. NPDC056161]|uniref:hypothetical protein n=1 Tax=Streptomyces sp. NPDC056161 TaxID=3345732 RepID=UPI0035DDFBF4
MGYRDARATAEHIRAEHIRSWTRHLADGMEIETTHLALDFAYYAHLLQSGPTVQGAPDQDMEELRDPLVKELTAAWLRELGAPRPAAQGALTMPLRYAASWVAEKFSLDGRLTELSSGSSSVRSPPTWTTSTPRRAPQYGRKSPRA